MEKQKGKTPSVCDWIGGGHCVVIDATNHPLSADDDNTADGTSLGPDNCVGVAYILALLGSTDIPHPPLEAVLTVMEEKGKVGGANYDTTKLTGTHMIDSNWITDDQILAGCGGDLTLAIDLPAAPDPTPEDYIGKQIAIRGLHGGHCEFDIHLERANAIVALARILARVSGRTDVRIAELPGGVQNNVIPADATSPSCSIPAARRPSTKKLRPPRRRSRMNSLAPIPISASTFTTTPALTPAGQPQPLPPSHGLAS